MHTLHLNQGKKQLYIDFGNMAVVLALTLAALAISATADQTSEVQQIDNCDTKWTDISPTHTMCLETVGPEVTLTQETKDAVVALHNRLRAEVDPPASNMAKLVWDDDVAEVASRWAATCQGGHDGGKNRLVPSLPRISIGQNGASGFGNLEGATMGWWNEVRYFQYGNDSQPSTTGRWQHIGHYTAVVLARSQRIGCGEAKCVKPDGRKFNMHYCNYVNQQLNTEIVRPYKTGESCAACPNHCDTSGKLCDFNGQVCMNGGRFNITSGRCNCLPFWTGLSCEIHFPEGCPKRDKDGCVRESFRTVSRCPYFYGVCTHDCGDLECQNGGSMNYKTCVCECPRHYTGDLCQINDCPATQPKICGNYWPETHCNIYSNMPGDCPYMCGVCPHECGERTWGRECQNGGTMNYKTCVCECFSSYSGDLCEIHCGGKVCQNGGEIDLKTCECKCSRHYTGDLCEKNGCPATQPKICGNHWPEPYCRKYANVPGDCPYMCGVCSHECGDRTYGRECQNGGTMNYQTCVCECRSYYTGDLCETNCRDKACTHGDLDPSTCNCRCEEGWTGDLCDQQEPEEAPLRNLALGSPAEQSSTFQYRDFHAGLAVDGNNDTSLKRGSSRSCTHTHARRGYRRDQWWRVDLQGQYSVVAVKITNRGDCCGDRLKSFSVYVDEVLITPGKGNHCIAVTSIAQGATMEYNCSQPMTGRYVTIVLPRGILTLCEVEVLGRPV